MRCAKIKLRCRLNNSFIFCKQVVIRWDVIRQKVILWSRSEFKSIFFVCRPQSKFSCGMFLGFATKVVPEKNQMVPEKSNNFKIDRYFKTFKLSQRGSVTHQMAVPIPSISCCVLNHHNLFYQIQNALAFNRDMCCHLALCLRLLPFHLFVFTLKNIEMV